MLCLLRYIYVTQPSRRLILCNVHRIQDCLLCSYAHRIKQAIFELGFVFICYFFNFKNVSKLYIFNEVFKGMEPQTNNYESNYLTTTPARDELPEIQF